MIDIAIRRRALASFGAALMTLGALLTTAGHIRASEAAFDPTVLRDSVLSLTLEGSGSIMRLERQNVPRLTNTDWYLHAALAPDGEMRRPADDIVVTTRFHAGQIRVATIGCNTMTGPYQSDGETLILGPLMTTKRACSGPRNAVETRVRTLLGRVSRSIMVNGDLVLLDGRGLPLLHYVRADG